MPSWTHFRCAHPRRGARAPPRALAVHTVLLYQLEKGSLASRQVTWSCGEIVIIDATSPVLATPCLNAELCTAGPRRLRGVAACPSQGLRLEAWVLALCPSVSTCMQIHAPWRCRLGPGQLPTPLPSCHRLTFSLSLLLRILALSSLCPLSCHNLATMLMASAFQ